MTVLLKKCNIRSKTQQQQTYHLHIDAHAFGASLNGWFIYLSP